MNKIKTYLPLFLLVFLISSAGFSSAEEGLTPLKDPLSGKKTKLRESEILGTLENPKISTEIPWQTPEGVDLNAPRIHRRFLKEIFRPVRPFSEINQKPEIK